jgi:hypothetical protein
MFQLLSQNFCKHKQMQSEKYSGLYMLLNRTGAFHDESFQPGEPVSTSMWMI